MRDHYTRTMDDAWDDHLDSLAEPRPEAPRCAYHATIVRALTSMGLDPGEFDTREIEEGMRDRQPNGCLDHLPFPEFAVEAAVVADYD